MAADRLAPERKRVASGVDNERSVRQLGAARGVALGNRANDEAMLRAVALGLAVIGGEGAFGPTLPPARVVARSPLKALDLLLNSERTVATLRP